MVADELRRQADVFADLVELRAKVGRHPAHRPPARGGGDVRSPAARRATTASPGAEPGELIP